MSLLDEAREFAGWSLLSYDGISRKVRDGVTQWERWRCVFCSAETLKGYHTEAQHGDDCRWQTTMPRIVKALEERERMIASMARVWGKVADDYQGTWKHFAEMGDLLYHATDGEKGRCAGYSGPPCEDGEGIRG